MLEKVLIALNIYSGMITCMCVFGTDDDNDIHAWSYEVKVKAIKWSVSFSLSYRKCFSLKIIKKKQYSGENIMKCSVADAAFLHFFSLISLIKVCIDNFSLCFRFLFVVRSQNSV